MKTSVCGLVGAFVALLCLVNGVPVPDNQPISFSTTTVSPSTTQSLKDVHSGLGSNPVCEDMLPRHDNIQPSTTPAPYQLSVNTTHVSKHPRLVYVNFVGKDNHEFRGLYVQARNVATNKPVGEFLPTDDEHVAFYNCNGGQNNAASYISRQGISEFNLGWFAPETPMRVRFNVTFVESYSKYWVGVQSEEIVIE